MRRFVLLLAALGALGFASAAGAVGPTLPAVEGIPVSAQGVSYVTHLVVGGTTLAVHGQGRVSRTVALSGHWGLPLVAYGTAPGGLSPNGNVLVLSDAVNIDGRLRPRSRFAIVDTRTLDVTRTIALRGDYSFDALSPQAATLYLIHHVSSEDATRYQVQAYDLRSGRLLPGVIADRSQKSWIMRGLPVARATEPGGRWVYTFYEQSDTYPFVHALDTVAHTAVCIGIPANWVDPWIGAARLRLVHGRLLIEQSDGKVRYTVDVSKRSFPVSPGTRVG
jgi:hypothetical protein